MKIIDGEVVVKLFEVKALVEANTEVEVQILEVYRDVGANLKHRNIIVFPSKGLSYQALTNAQVDLAELGLLPITEVEELINKINTRGW